jgi:nicotinate-nucleotide adenylyltransferase
LFELAHIGVLSRAGHAMTESDALAAEVRARRTSDPTALRQAAAGQVVEIRVSALEISATRIRSELAAGREPRYLVPEALLTDPSLLAGYR